MRGGRWVSMSFQSLNCNFIRFCETVDYEFSKQDFNSALELLRKAAAKYDANHSSAPDLDGFLGADLSPGNFKDMLYRTFKIVLTPKQLGSLVKFFG